MKTALASLLLAGCAATGCLSMPSWWEKTSPATPSTTEAKPVRQRPAVTAEQINDGNAHEMAGALLDELDCDAQTRSMSSTEKAPGTGKSADGKQH